MAPRTHGTTSPFFPEFQGVQPPELEWTGGISCNVLLVAANSVVHRQDFVQDLVVTAEWVQNELSVLSTWDWVETFCSTAGVRYLRGGAHLLNITEILCLLRLWFVGPWYPEGCRSQWTGTSRTGCG